MRLKVSSEQAMFLKLLDKSIEASVKAEKALGQGKDVYCQEVLDFKQTVRDVNNHPYAKRLGGIVKG